MTGAKNSRMLLTVPETAEYLNVTERFIRRLVYERRIEYSKLGKHVRFTTQALDEFVKQGTVLPNDQTSVPRRR